ncbi:hypothetical protein D3C72_1224810 [compost metagenome]
MGGRGGSKRSRDNTDGNGHVLQKTGYAHGFSSNPIVAAQSGTAALRKPENVLDNILTRLTKNSSQETAKAQNQMNPL